MHVFIFPFLQELKVLLECIRWLLLDKVSVCCFRMFFYCVVLLGTDPLVYSSLFCIFTNTNPLPNSDGLKSSKVSSNAKFLSHNRAFSFTYLCKSDTNISTVFIAITKHNLAEKKRSFSVRFDLLERFVVWESVCRNQVGRRGSWPGTDNTPPYKRGEQVKALRGFRDLLKKYLKELLNILGMTDPNPEGECILNPHRSHPLHVCIEKEKKSSVFFIFSNYSKPIWWVSVCLFISSSLLLTVAT